MPLPIQELVTLLNIQHEPQTYTRYESPPFAITDVGYELVSNHLQVLRSNGHRVSYSDCKVNQSTIHKCIVYPYSKYYYMIQKIKSFINNGV